MPAPMKAKRVNIDIYDGTYFVDFKLADGEAVTLVGAPARCKLASAGPGSNTPLRRSR
jgi:ABC-type uncharacterized transport system substrate-binding protein